MSDNPQSTTNNEGHPRRRSHLFNLSSGTGAKGDAFARVESVESISRKGINTLLHPMTILFPESKVTAILGPSGSGKTTLLNFLTGTVASNMKAKGIVNMTGQIGFVPQDDHLHGFYTCREYMMHYLRLTGMECSSEAEDLAMDLLSGLGLENHVDTVVGDVFRKGLSGGQKRRLSVALEALSRPETLFLDEPTSGLDSESAYHLIKFLVDYANVPGRRVILTIHQPNSFIWEMMENVVLLSEGKLMYQGPRVDMELFFASTGHPCRPHYNPADFYVSMVNSEFQMQSMDANRWEVAFQEWQKRMKPKETSELVDFNSSFVISGDEIDLAFLEQSSRGNIAQVALALTKRNMLNLWKNPGTFGTRVFMYVMLSLCIGAMFWDLGSNKTDSGITARVSLIFYCVAFFVFMSIAVVPFSMMERGIVEKEVRNGYYHPAVYLVSQAVASVFGTFLLALITSAITVSMTGLRDFGWYFLNMFLALNCAESIAYLISFIAPHYIVGIAVVAGLYGLFMIFQGFMLVPSDFPSWLAWTNDVSFHTYTWRTFMYKEFEGDITFDSIAYPTGMDVLEFYEIDNVNPTNDMLVLVLYAAIINILCMILLHVKHVMHRRRQVHS
jgi:ABC-type multidrug transport system ATPase subunit/ABC-type multidrug transport system permease subunit